jgi:transcription-repair coupling factor (superfamily II helicase)
MKNSLISEPQTYFQTDEILAMYRADALFQLLENKAKSPQIEIVQVQNVAGSQTALLVAALQQARPEMTQLILAEDNEKAAYFYSDLISILEQKSNATDPTVLFFPTSYKKPYQFEKIDNANVLQRAETLAQLQNLYEQGTFKGKIVVTYPAALTERVVNKRTLLSNTFTIHKSEALGRDFLVEVLQSYGFERADFVYEAGQYAVRGGIVDVFSYAHELPFRVEFFGDEVESLRLFEPNSQLSKQVVEKAILIPNLEAKFSQESREPFFNFLPAQTLFWVENQKLTLEVIEKYFEKVVQEFDEIVKAAGYTQVISKPEHIFLTREEFIDGYSKFSQFHYHNGLPKKLYPKNIEPFVVDFQSKAQPSFDKDFKLLAEDLKRKQDQNYTNILVADLPKQVERMQSIFEEIEPQLEIRALLLSLHEGFYDQNLKLTLYTDHQIFERFHKGKGTERFSKTKALTIKELNALQVGDYVTHIDYGIGRFAGLEKIEVGGREQEAVRLIYRDNDILLVSLHSLHKIARYTGKEGSQVTLSKLGTGEWENKKRKVKKRLKDIGKDLINLYAKRLTVRGFACKPDDYMQIELETSFLYEDTPDQAIATAQIKADMEKPVPMDRLVCGDVGFGKTELAIRAAFKAVANGKQVAVLVPTTILAAQHYRTFSERLKSLPVRVDYINRFRTAKEVKQIVEDLKNGKIDILIGTHKIVSKTIQFKDLGLFIIDEEQKFGVKTKEKLKELRHNVDCLTLTATPIPRTLQFSLLGARDLSIMHTPPPNRQPVTTELHTFSEETIRDAVSYELRRGGQVFFVHNRVSDIYEVAGMIARLVPDAKVGIGHGQMADENLEKVMMHFINGQLDVLVATNIVESGLDIPNANTIIINNAHLFGLSDLHQMRGRVGRSNRKAYCFLLVPSVSTLTVDSRKRLSVLEEFNELGDGFKIAMRDLDIRGAGDLLGAEQSGFINDLGLDAYHKILEEAISELKEEEFKDLFAHERKDTVMKVDCNIETDFNILIPEDYIPNISERLSLYIRADELKTEQDLVVFRNELKDRFGQLPPTVEELLKTVELRWLAEKIGFEKLTLKNEKMRAYFVSGKPQYFESEVFSKFLAYVQKRPERCQVKETDSRLIFTMENVRSIEGAMRVLQSILEEDIKD